MNKILLVDDELNVLNALKRELRNIFEIEAFDNPVKALAHCKDHQFDLVIADYKMPDMNGIEFLKKFGQLQPNASRVVLSGEADIDALLQSINETHIYRFISKPWDQAELLTSIQNALAYRETIMAGRRDFNEGLSSSDEQTQNDLDYSIVLIESDPRLQALMVRSLADDSGVNLLSAMRQEFGQKQPRKKSKCSVIGFGNAQDAIAHVQETPCDLVLTADTLSDMEGVQLLIRLKELAPKVARILISNSPDKTMLMQAINAAEVNNVLKLHWNSLGQHSDAHRQAWNLYQLNSAVVRALAGTAASRTT